MKTFQDNADTRRKQVAWAAAWMMSRYARNDHWWTWRVLVRQNPDPDPHRPVFDEHTARGVFAELAERKLLVPAGERDGEPTHYMRHDIDGWEKAVIDGWPIRGRWLKYRRTWPTLVAGIVLGALGKAGWDVAATWLKKEMHGGNAALTQPGERKP